MPGKSSKKYSPNGDLPWLRKAKQNHPKQIQDEVARYSCAYLGRGPLPVTVANEGVVRDPLLKCNNPGGHCYLEGAGIFYKKTLLPDRCSPFFTL